MDQSFTWALLLLSFSAAFGKYVYVEEKRNWHEARYHCQTFYTDLAPVSNEYDISLLRRLVGDSQEFIWIGMKRHSTDPDKWMWAGGGEVSMFFWAPTQPNNRPNEDYGVIQNYMVHDSGADFDDPAFCYNVFVVRERKTWEGALDYCRTHHRDLASVGSEAEMLLIQRELSRNVSTERVWIGLRFFSGEWLWVDRQPVRYEAWAQEQKPECPHVTRACAALQVRGQTPNACDGEGSLISAANCADKLNRPGGSEAGAGVNHAWEARDCEERRHFICY